MKKKIWDFIAANPGSTHHQCAAALDVEELETLKTINELAQKGYLILRTLPLGNKINPDCSCFWYAGKEYSE